MFEAFTLMTLNPISSVPTVVVTSVIVMPCSLSVASFLRSMLQMIVSDIIKGISPRQFAKFLHDLVIVL